jgi:energy-converting hydrogenase Eha subunit C
MDMTKDKALEELFLAQKPQFTDNADFMASLTKRLDAVEFIKQHQEASIRRYKMAMVAAFIVGIISGALAIALVLSSPAEPLFTFSIQSAFLLWVAENSRLIVATAIALLMTVGTVSIIGNVQDIQRMRRQLKMDMTCC